MQLWADKENTTMLFDDEPADGTSDGGMADDTEKDGEKDGEGGGETI